MTCYLELDTPAFMITLSLYTSVLWLTVNAQQRTWAPYSYIRIRASNSTSSPCWIVAGRKSFVFRASVESPPIAKEYQFSLIQECIKILLEEQNFSSQTSNDYHFNKFTHQYPSLSLYCCIYCCCSRTIPSRPATCANGTILSLSETTKPNHECHARASSHSLTSNISSRLMKVITIWQLYCSTIVL